VHQLPSNEIRGDDNWIVEKYINNPLLLNNKKFDLRLYVAITSFDPLQIYLHDEGIHPLLTHSLTYSHLLTHLLTYLLTHLLTHAGLVRLATADYSKKDFSNRYEHLTNYSVNKHNIQTSDESVGNSESNTLKLTLNDLRDKLRSQFSEDQIKAMYALALSYLPTYLLPQLTYLLTYLLTH
jgi:hypothetical protein